MVLRKHPRLPMRRTTSMTGITFDPDHIDYEALEVTDARSRHQVSHDPVAAGRRGGRVDRLSANISDAATSGGGAELVRTAYFLWTCELCKRRLFPGRDIYMYRGDTAFCSWECREHQMERDEHRDRDGGRRALINP